MTQNRRLLFGLQGGRLLHEFLPAAATLTRALALEPGSVELRLLQADVLLRAGEPAAARQACVPVALAGYTAFAAYCVLQWQLVSGQSDEAWRLATRLLPGAADLPPAARSWAIEMTAMAALANGRESIARGLYAAATADSDAPLASRIAYADLLLASGSGAEQVLSILAKDRAHPAAQVRLAAASQQRSEPVATDIQQSITTLIAASDTTAPGHLTFRDRAVFALDYHGDVPTALVYASANWAQQKGVEDLLLLRRVATRAGATDELAALDEWQATARRTAKTGSEYISKVTKRGQSTFFQAPTTGLAGTNGVTLERYSDPN